MFSQNVSDQKNGNQPEVLSNTHDRLAIPLHRRVYAYVFPTWTVQHAQWSTWKTVTEKMYLVGPIKD